MCEETTTASTRLACLERLVRGLNRKISLLGSLLFHGLRLGSILLSIWWIATLYHVQQRLQCALPS